MSGIIDIATAIAALLTTGKNAGWFSAYPTIGTIERRWSVEDLEIADVASLRISVVPVSQETREKISRIRDTLDPVVSIGLMARLPAAFDIKEPTDLDPYVGLGVRVAEIIVTGTLPSPAADAKLIGIEHTLVDRARLVQSRCFFSVINTTWRVAQDARVALP